MPNLIRTDKLAPTTGCCGSGTGCTEPCGCSTPVTGRVQSLARAMASLESPGRGSASDGAEAQGDSSNRASAVGQHGGAAAHKERGGRGSEWDAGHGGGISERDDLNMTVG